MATLNSLNFRTWLQEMWMQHQDELQTYNQPLPYNQQEYFAKYKYWLKREYRHQKGNKNV
jgi:hypothetical protein